jgi:membrane protease YdiL (CAAX protease family)
MWNNFESFLLDVLIAAAFWIVSMLALAALRLALGTLPKADDVAELKRTLGFLVPGTTQELVLWLLVSLTAGFCEEIIFRGYLQQQFRLLTNSALFGIIASGLLFGGGHGYQGPRMMVVLAVYGMMFGALAHWRRSLRPGMIAHAWQDAITGIVSRVLLR